MFQAALTDKLKKIFLIKKVTFQLPGDSAEQDCLFIEIDSSRNTIKDGIEAARVTGRIRLFTKQDKLPYGFFSKRINEANISDTIDFFFFDFEENAGRFLDICERSIRFVFFYSAQYDPEIGTIDEITLNIQVNE